MRKTKKIRPTDHVFLRALILDSLGTCRNGMTARRLYELVTEAYGVLSERRFWRHLQRLVLAGIVLRTGRINVNSLYERVKNVSATTV